jgi:hypothetical protein
MIQNKGIAPIDSFIVFGVSTSRNNDSAIGNFGSGTKMAMLHLLRKNMPPVIYCGTEGKDRLMFDTVEHRFDDGLDNIPYNKVHYKLNQLKHRVLPVSTDYGQDDWNTDWMAVREFVANAIDRTVKECGSLREAVSGDLAIMPVEDNQVRAKSGYTRVFIPMSEEVQKVYGDLPNLFLHFRHDNSINEKFLPKREKGPAKIYKKGVFVRTVEGKDSIYDYNFGDSLELNESRMVDDYQVKSRAAMILRKESTSAELATILNKLLDNEECLESTFDKYYLDADHVYNKKEREAVSEVWQEAWKLVAGDALMGTGTISTEFAEKKGYRVRLLLNDNWAGTLKSYGIATTETVLCGVEQDGHHIREVSHTSAAQRTLNEIWSWVEQIEETNGKEKPEIKLFSKNREAGSQVFGKYEDGIIYVEEMHASNRNKELADTILHEVGHHVTGATDTSPDFAAWFIKFVIKVCWL